jgi:hypothetical protein
VIQTLWLAVARIVGLLYVLLDDELTPTGMGVCGFSFSVIVTLDTKTQQQYPLTQRLIPNPGFLPTFSEETFQRNVSTTDNTRGTT